MEKVLIIGAGGHGREVLDILRDMERIGGAAPIGFIDDNPALAGQSICGLSVIGDLNSLVRHDPADTSLVIAVGFPLAKKRLHKRLSTSKFQYSSAISPRANISPWSKLGKGVLIFPSSSVGAGAEIGSFVTLNFGASVSHDCRIGDYTAINPGARLAGNVRVGECVNVGIGASVIPGIGIGSWATIGPGETVLHNIEDDPTMAGVPEKPPPHMGVPFDP